MADKNPMDDLLDDLFAEAKQDPEAQASAHLITRVLADATQYQPVTDLAQSPNLRRPFWQVIFEVLGGWQGTSGLVAATMASVWIGFNGADSLTVEGIQAVISGDTEYYLSDLGGDFIFDSEEG